MFTSSPVLFNISNGRYIIFTTQGNTLIPVIVFSKKIFTEDDENYVVPIQIPNIAYSTGTPSYEVTILSITSAPVISPKTNGKF